MRRIRWIAACAAFAAVASTAAWAVPTSHVDPQAPCFRWPAVDMDGDGVFDRIDHCVNTKAGCAVDAYGCDLDQDHDGVCDGLDRCPGTPAGERVDEHGCSGASRAAQTPPAPTPTPPPPAPVATRKMENQLLETGRIRLENVYFESGRAKLLPESEAALREAGETLELYPLLVVEIQGHTDTRGAGAYNRRLSQERAESVRLFLLERFHLEPTHLIALGYGETQPETHERNDEELLRNRRVELHVRNPEALPKRVKIEKN